MGFARRQARKAKHAAGGFDEQKRLYAGQLDWFNIKIYYRDVESDAVQKEMIGGTTTVERRLARCNASRPGFRILAVKRSTGRKWRKEEPADRSAYRRLKKARKLQQRQQQQAAFRPIRRRVINTSARSQKTTL